MTTDSSIPENRSETPKKASELEERKRTGEPANPAGCTLEVRIDERGNVEVIGMGQSCPRILTELPPVRKEFWLRRTKPELRRKIEEQQEKEATQQGK